MGFPSPSLNVVFDYFSHSCPKMCKICLKRPLDVTFLDCLALTFCDVIGELLPEWACLTLQGGTTFLLTSKLADIPVSRVRKGCHISHEHSLWQDLSLSTIIFGRIAKQFRLMDWWCPSVCLSTFRLTSVFKFVLGHIIHYKLHSLLGNRPWWDLLNCDLSLWPWPWLFLFKVTL